MCTVSFIGDSWQKTTPQTYPWIYPYVQPDTKVTIAPSEVSRDEFLKLKREVEELKKLLTAAKEFDAATGQPDCEMDEKVELIKRVAELVGVDLGDLFTK